MIVQTGDNAFSTVKFIVSKVSGEGTHSTISDALNDSESGDNIFVKPGVYEEDLSLKGGVNITASSYEQVTILGKCTLEVSGNVLITGITLKTNGSFLLFISGAADGNLNIKNCFIDCDNHSGIRVAVAGIELNFSDCFGDLRTTGIYYLRMIVNSIVRINRTQFNNSGISSTISEIQIGKLFIGRSILYSGLIITAASLYIHDSNISTVGLNVRCITLNNSSINEINRSRLDSGSMPTVLISTGCRLVLFGMNSLVSTNAQTVTGTGTIEYAPACFSGSSNAATMTVTNRVVTKIGRDIIVSGTINAYIDEKHAFSMTEDGEFTYPLHPAFSAVLNNNIPNVTGTGTVYQVMFDSEIFDQGNDFDLVTSTFTAPVSGKYRLSARVTVENGVNMVGVNLKIITSNRNYSSYFLSKNSSPFENYPAVLDQLCDMDAGDTAYVEVFSTGELSDTNGVMGDIDNYTAFSGNLET